MTGNEKLIQSAKDALANYDIAKARRVSVPPDRLAVILAELVAVFEKAHTPPLVASLPPATDPHEPEDAHNGEEDHRSDPEPEIAVRSTGQHQHSAEYAQDDRDCETDPSEHRSQAAYSHRSTLADRQSAVEGA